jgi:hypothetical protein
MKSRKLLIIVVLFGLFAIPFFLARWVYTEHASTVLTQLGTVNQGKLIEPPIHLVVQSNVKLEKKWYLIYVTSDKNLVKSLKDKQMNKIMPITTTLDKIQRIRLSLGKKFSQIGALLVLSHQENIPMPVVVQEAIPEVTIPENTIDALLTFSGGSEGVFIVDPDRNVILAYSVDTDSEAIYKDLGRLLKSGS